MTDAHPNEPTGFVMLETVRALSRPLRKDYVPDCHHCGACCGGTMGLSMLRASDVLDLPPDALGGENEALSPSYAGKVRSRGRNRKVALMMDTCGGRCSQLRGVLGESAYCQVYHYRPGFCRTFAAGSWNCLVSRLWKGLDVPGWFRAAHGRVLARG